MATQTPTAIDATPAGRAWRDAMDALTGGWADQYRRLTEVTASMWSAGAGAGAGRTDSGKASEFARRLAENARDVTGAQIGVTTEWLRAPLWAAGVGSPADLQARYFRLFDAYRTFYRTWIDAALEWQRGWSGATEQAAETAREVVDMQVQTARRVANDARTVQQAAVDTTQTVTETAREATARVVDQARVTSDRAFEQARELVTEAPAQVSETARTVASAQAETARTIAEGTREMAQSTANAVNEAASRIAGTTGQANGAMATRPIKGNIKPNGEKIYHLPGQPDYDSVKPETTFATEAEARAAGFRAVSTPGLGPVKGKVNREGERIYHLPGQANYDRVEADHLFLTEGEAQTAGFRLAQR